MRRATAIAAAFAAHAAASPATAGGTARPIAFAFEAVSVTPGQRVAVRAEGVTTDRPVRLCLVHGDLRTRVEAG